MCFETTEPERDVWGDNNDNMRTAFMVRIAESDKKSYAGKIGKVRNMITDPKRSHPRALAVRRRLQNVRVEALIARPERRLPTCLRSPTIGLEEPRDARARRFGALSRGLQRISSPS